MVRGLKITIPIFGSIVVGLLVVQVTILGPRAKSLENDRQNIQAINATLASDHTIEWKASEIERLLAKLADPLLKNSQSRALAGLYEVIGQARISRGDFAQAEGALMRACSLDPSNERLVTDLAAFYSNWAMSRTSIDDKWAAYKESGKWWDKAASAARDPNTRSRYLDAEGRTFLTAATELIRQGRYVDADQACALGMTVSAENSELYRRFDDARVRAIGHMDPVPMLERNPPKTRQPMPKP